MNIFQKGFNFGQDGPGNRLVYHLQGCNMRCPWCSNPEGMDKNPSHMREHNKNRTEITVDGLVDEILRSRAMFFGGGGVTLTGGEPTLQFDEVFELLKKLTEEKINTCVETNGSHKRLAELAPFINHLIIDLKHTNERTHIEFTGITAETTKKNIIKAAECGVDLTVRIPLINGFNATNTDAEDFRKFFSQLDKSKFKAELLPYHEYGKDKWAKNHMEYKMQDGFVTDEQIAEFSKILNS